MKPVEEYYNQMLDPSEWSKAPHPVREMAEECSKEGIFTGIAWDDYFGWMLLQMDNDTSNKRIAWSERNFVTHDPGDKLDDMDYLF